METQADNCTNFPDLTTGDVTRPGGYPLIRSNRCIGENCMIGSYVHVEGDILIGNNVSLRSSCYIGVGSLFTKEVPDGAMVASNSARVVGRVQSEDLL